MYIHGTNTISDTEIGKGVAPGYRQLSRQRVCVCERGGGGGGGETPSGTVYPSFITCFVSHMQGKSTDG